MAETSTVLLDAAPTTTVRRKAERIAAKMFGLSRFGRGGGDNATAKALTGRLSTEVRKK